MKNRKYGRMVAMALAAMMAMPTVAFAATTWDEDTAYYGALEQGKVPEEVMKQDEMGQYVISDGTATTPVEPVALPFTDVKEGDACYAAVQYVYTNKLMAGTTDTTFEPEAPLQRAMLAQILYNKEGAKDVATESKYTDVEIGRWYATASLWAADKGLMTGVSETEFAPKENLTVEQLVQILYNYAKFKGVDVTVATATDVATASDWAKDAISSAKDSVANVVENVTISTEDLVQKVENSLNHFIEAVAVMIITSCVIPMLVLLLFFWMVKIVLDVDLSGVKIKGMLPERKE